MTNAAQRVPDAEVLKTAELSRDQITGDERRQDNPESEARAGVKEVHRSLGNKIRDPKRNHREIQDGVRKKFQVR